MRHAVILTGLLCLAAAPAPAQSAREQEETILDLIELNNGELTRTLVLPSSEVTPSKIWIHIRSPDQRDEAAKISNLLQEGVHLGRVTRSVDLRPVQEVGFGPDAAQVRYFKEEDRATANEIARQLTEAGLATTSENFVEAFKDASYIDVGHIEIWLPETAN